MARLSSASLLLVSFLVTHLSISVPAKSQHGTIAKDAISSNQRIKDDVVHMLVAADTEYPTTSPELKLSIGLTSNTLLNHRTRRSQESHKDRDVNKRDWALRRQAITGTALSIDNNESKYDQRKQGLHRLNKESSPPSDDGGRLQSLHRLSPVTRKTRSAAGIGYVLVPWSLYSPYTGVLARTTNDVEYAIKPWSLHNQKIALTGHSDSSVEYDLKPRSGQNPNGADVVRPNGRYKATSNKKPRSTQLLKTALTPRFPKDNEVGKYIRNLWRLLSPKILRAD